ncbi:MAG: CRISPR-associated helicase Cas3' [Desulfobacteraceae bacterium]|jgi:CRISPR-associated endonuclease/helicase Cas3
MALEEYYAHSLSDHPKKKWQLLNSHLENTADLARKFAQEFDSGEWGYLAGLWHDLGKYTKAFQKKLLNTLNSETTASKTIRVDHSTAGALHAVNQFNLAGRIFAYIIAGHHAGLTDWHADRSGPSALSYRLTQSELLKDTLKATIPSKLLNQKLPSQNPIGRDPAFWIRMLFSCVVDADFLDTENFYDENRAALRSNYPELTDLWKLFEVYMEDKQKAAQKTSVNAIRAEIFSRCLNTATRAKGIYSLTVPTGGGKTLASMAFALKHALFHHQQRIIYVIPYTSIIEQTADQFRKIFGRAVVEHHSNLEVDDETKESQQVRLASENWDAPIIVTTSVQFFESLFAGRTSRCRKLHNMVNSVVILDEVQLLPPEFLTPILKVMDELNKNYGVTFLLSTATQPAFAPRPELSFQGLTNIEEIIKAPQTLYQRMRRCRYQLPADLSTTVSWKDLAEELSRHSSVLCIVNRRDDCRILWSLMPKDTIHLSGLMCGAHRSEKINAIKTRLKQGLPTRVISTQLVEAGVDVDFPVVYRALAGLDSIAQAAGRCNREGLLDEGCVHLFIPPTLPPVGILRQAAQISAHLLQKRPEDPLALPQFESFFTELYWMMGDRLDKNAILRDLAPDSRLRFAFRSAAEKFRLIDDTIQAPVLVNYGENSRELIDQLRRCGPQRFLMRRLQRLVVNLPRRQHAALLNEGAIGEVHPGIFVQQHPALYDEDLGVCPDRSIIYDPDDLII